MRPTCQFASESGALVSQFPVTEAQLNSMTECQSSIIDLLFKNFQG